MASSALTTYVHNMFKLYDKKRWKQNDQNWPTSLQLIFEIYYATVDNIAVRQVPSNLTARFEPASFCKFSY
jgi:hypothetical protein